MKKASNTNRGITWGIANRLQDLEYADDICLLAHTFSDMNHKLARLTTEAEKVGLKININKTKEMRMNTSNTQHFTINGHNIERVSKFAYLGSIIDRDGGTEQDVQERIKKAMRAFGTLNNIWRSGIYSTSTKIRLFNTNVKSVLLYGCESWKMTKTIATRLQVFINRALRRICHIFWPNRISNEDLWRRTKQESVTKEITRKKWGWLGHTLRRPPDNISRRALEWNPQGRRKVGRPHTTWRSTILEEAQQTGKSWQEIKALATDRVRWKQLVEALCSTEE